MSEKRLLTARWHQERVEIERTKPLAPEAEKVLAVSLQSQRETLRDIRRGDMAIITQLNADGTYSHELIYRDPARPFPAYRETGTWAFDAQTRVLSGAMPGGDSTLSPATVIGMTRDRLVFRRTFETGRAEGIAETVYLRRFDEPKHRLA